MITTAPDPSSVTVSIAVYRMLLMVYPKGFRQEYGPQMLQVFRDCCLRASSNQGLAGMIWLWTSTLVDLIKSMVDEHLQWEIEMTKEKFIRWSGWALAFGGIAFTLAIIVGSFDPNWEDPLGGKDALVEYAELGLMVLSHLLFLIGLIGLHGRYARQVGQPGSTALLLAPVGAAAALVGASLMETTYVDWSWTLWVSGMMVMMVPLVIFGILAMRAQLMRRWNWSPIMAGFWLPALFFIGLGLEALSIVTPDLGEMTFPILSVLSMLGFILLGLALQGDPQVEVAAA